LRRAPDANAVRAFPLLLASLLLAGCASTGGTPSTPTDAGTTPTGTAGSGTQASFLGAHVEHNYTAADETKAIDIPAGAGPVNVDLHYTGAGTGSATVCVTQQSDAVITLVAPDGQTFLQDKYDANGIVGANPNGHCSGDKQAKGVTLQPGTWRVVFNGTANGYLIGVLDIGKAT